MQARLSADKPLVGGAYRSIGAEVADRIRSNESTAKMISEIRNRYNLGPDGERELVPPRSAVHFEAGTRSISPRGMIDPIQFQGSLGGDRGVRTRRGGVFAPGPR